MRVGFIQFEVKLGDLDWNRGKSADMLETADADLIVLPELCTSGYMFTSKEEAESLAEPLPDGSSVKLWQQIAARKNMHIVAGIAEKADDGLYNSSVLVRPSGEVEVYRKSHLFYEEKLWFNAGDTGFRVFDIGQARIGLMICFDWIFPESARTLALRGADIICHSANLVMPFCQDATVTRCLENRVFTIMANRTGIERRNGRQHTFTGRSRIVSPFGEVLSEAAPRDDVVNIVEIDPADARNKALNEYNDLFKDRRPDLYEE